jgi:hypothetical protein
MPDRSRKRPRDSNQLAKFVVDLATGELDDITTTEGKNPAAVALGRLGGIKGGVARAQSLSPDERRKIARKASHVRWGRTRQKKDKPSR